MAIREPDQAARWAVQLQDWRHRWHAMLHERAFAREHPDDPRAARQSWRWTHQPLRRCYRRLERLWRNGTLFAFLDPYRSLDQLHEQRKEGHPDDDTTGMGDDIDWNEFHNPTRYLNTAD